jgi:hypothetical protein
MNKLSLNKKLESLEAERKRRSEIKTTIHVKFFINGNIQIGDKLYKPEPTALKVSKDKSLVIALLGPVGCGKSLTNHIEMVRHCCTATECKDGVFRSRNYLVRNTYEDLKRTTFKDWDQWMDCLPKTRKTDKPLIRHYEFNFWREETDKIYKAIMELDGVAIDQVDKVKKRFRSIQATTIQLNEASELDESIFNEAFDRLGRYPAVDDRANKNIIVKKMFLDTNPPDIGHWFHRLFEIVKPPKYKIYHYPPGLVLKKDKTYELNQKAENISHLENDYYINNAYGKEKSYIDVMYMGHYGIMRSGDPVYESYNDDLHAVDSIDFVPGQPVYLGFDFGLTPCALFDQLINGVRYSIKEFTTIRSQLNELLENTVMPFLNTTLKGYEIIIAADPSGIAVPQSEGRHCFDVLKDYGLINRDELSNKLLPRLDAVRGFLNRMVNGKPAYQISKTGCPILHKGYLGNYYWKEIIEAGKKEPGQVPCKTHPHSDIHDAGQYNALTMIGETQIQQDDYVTKKHTYKGGW